MERYYSYKRYMEDIYGEPHYRIPVDFNSGCPNRDEDGKGGCSFCSVKGSRSIQTLSVVEVEDQIKTAMEFSRRRYRAKRFTLYFQAYTAYFTKEWQRRYEEIFSRTRFDAITISTRPDCLDDEALSYLKDLSSRYDLSIELGVQTSNDESLKRVNRGHDYSCSKIAIEKLKQLGIKVIVHLIIGLPGETFNDYKQSVLDFTKQPIDGIKFHNLHIVKDSDLGAEYQRSPFTLLYEDQYCDYLTELIRYIPSKIPILRLVTDSESSNLIAPKWQMSKGQFKEYFENSLQFKDIFQGDLVETIPHRSIPFDKVETEDGTLTFYSRDFKERYHSKLGAKSESYQKFVEPSDLVNRLKRGDIEVLDICFGLGYNSLAACEAAEGMDSNLSVTALELDRRVVLSSADHIDYGDRNFNQSLKELYDNGSSNYKDCSIEIKYGDGRYTITKLNKKFDIIFLDPFSTQKNSELWSVEFFKKLRSILKDDGVIVTYSSAIPVRNGLTEVGFFVGEISSDNSRRVGTIATLKSELIKNPLPQSDLELFKTTRGLTYRDPYSVWSNKEILKDREDRIVEMKRNLQGK
jgi:radical SAM protein (TIGR01212 family)